MASTIRVSLFVVTCWLLVGSDGANENTPELMSFYDVNNGVFTNMGHEYEEQPIVLTNRPVIVDAIPKGVVVYTEKRVDGRIVSQRFEAITEVNNEVFQGTVYNIAEDKVATLNFDDLSNITPEDLHIDTSCSFTYILSAIGVYVVDNAECRETVYINSLRAVISCEFVEYEDPDTLFVPLKRKGKRFPSPYPDDKFDPPCPDDDTDDNSE